MIAFAGAALAQQFLDDEVAPAAKSELDFTTSADIAGAMALPAYTDSAASFTHTVTVAKAGYTLSGTEDAPTVTATIDVTAVTPNLSVVEEQAKSR